MVPGGPANSIQSYSNNAASLAPASFNAEVTEAVAALLIDVDMYATGFPAGASVSLFLEWSDAAADSAAEGREGSGRGLQRRAAPSAHHSMLMTPEGGVNPGNTCKRVGGPAKVPIVTGFVVPPDALNAVLTVTAVCNKFPPLPASPATDATASQTACKAPFVNPVTGKINPNGASFVWDATLMAVSAPTYEPTEQPTRKASGNPSTGNSTISAASSGAAAASVSTGTIIGAVMGILAMVACIAAGYYFYSHDKEDKKHPKHKAFSDGRPSEIFDVEMTGFSGAHDDERSRAMHSNHDGDTGHAAGGAGAGLTAGTTPHEFLVPSAARLNPAASDKPALPATLQNYYANTAVSPLRRESMKVILSGEQRRVSMMTTGLTTSSNMQMHTENAPEEVSLYGRDSGFLGANEAHNFQQSLHDLHGLPQPLASNPHMLHGAASFNPLLGATHAHNAPAQRTERMSISNRQSFQGAGSEELNVYADQEDFAHENRPTTGPHPLHALPSLPPSIDSLTLANDTPANWGHYFDDTDVEEVQYWYNTATQATMYEMPPCLRAHGAGLGGQGAGKAPVRRERSRSIGKSQRRGSRSGIPATKR